MPAKRDPKQKFTFVYKNLYQIHADEKPKNASTYQPILIDPRTKSKVAPTVLEQFKVGKVEPQRYEPPEIIQPNRKRASAQELDPRPLSSRAHWESPAVSNLKRSLKELNQLHSRLKFMLREIENAIPSDSSDDDSK